MEKYKELGKAAHKLGKMRTPALDPDIMAELGNMPVGTGAVEILTAWAQGWDESAFEDLREFEIELFGPED